MKLRYHILSMALLLGLYLVVLTPFTAFMRNKPIVEKLGIIPRAEILQVLSADQKQMVAASVIAKVILYFGGLVDKSPSEIPVPPDFPAMSRTIHAALKLDPYNMDGYYFAQAVLVWDVKQYKLANDLLEYGMKYRTWDWSLPYFAGFNSAYFLKDYAAAARYYQRAGELSGSDLSRLLAGRYMQESGQTALAISYLSAMLKGEHNPALKKSYQLRLTAFREARRIELARDRFHEARGALPTTVGQLVSAGFLSPPPRDPYGGQFYLEADGKVATTSKYAFAGVKK